MPKRRYSKQAYSVNPEFIEEPQKPEYRPEKEGYRII